MNERLHLSDVRQGLRVNAVQKPAVIPEFILTEGYLTRRPGEKQQVAVPIDSVFPQVRSPFDVRAKTLQAGIVEELPITTRSELHMEGVDFNSFVTGIHRVDLGNVQIKHDVASTLAPFKFSSEHKPKYPDTVTTALGNIFTEYNEAFKPLVEANREHPTDYQFAPTNHFVQIDMVGLPDAFLSTAANLPVQDVQDIMKGRIFEIENSIAMYSLLQDLFSSEEQNAVFKNRFRQSLDSLREKHGKQIALLAVTDQKHQAMRETEFGKTQGETLTDDEVKQISGFDKLFGPDEFLTYLSENGGSCDYLLYARTSDPIEKLKDPKLAVKNPLLEDGDIRRIIKANAITFNIDDPNVDQDSESRINDTKRYLAPMGIAFPAFSISDVLSPDYEAFLKKQSSGDQVFPGKTPFSPELEEFLATQEVNMQDVLSGGVNLRAKPMAGAFGCYGHVRGTVKESDFRKDIRKNMRERGPYVIQPEMPVPTLENTADGEQYVYIDRNFFFTDGVKDPVFLGGFRALMPAKSREAQSGRIHGAADAVFAEIT